MEQARPKGKEIKVEDSDSSESSGGEVVVTVAAAEPGGIEGEMKAAAVGEEIRSVWEKPKAHVIIDLIRKNDEYSEFMLGRLLEEAESHRFYCPNCNAPIEKVDVVRKDIQHVECTCCFSILKLIGDRLESICNPRRGRGTDQDPKSQAPSPTQEPPLTPTPVPVPQDPKSQAPSPTQEPPLTPTPVPVPSVTQDPNTPTATRPAKKWDILKSIVYGGLIESIASLSIVTSAAGADATTLKILALGLANLIGGLFVIGHNLIEVRNDKADNQNGGGGGGDGESSDHQRTTASREGDGRYERELGERENFKRHAAVTVLSFLLFGLVAPVTYGFSFLKSDDKEMKLVAVAAASLICITMLAIAKAYILKASTFRGYLKILLIYVIPGFMASGLSYVVAHFVNKLLQKLGLFDSSSSSSNYSVFMTDQHHPYLSLPGTTSTAKSGWGF